MNDLEKRILEISWKNKSSHISSCLSNVNIINDIYKIKRKDDIFMLSAAHGSLGWFTVLEHLFGYNAEELHLSHGTHSKRDLGHGILCSGGHLGQVLTVCIGFSLVNKDRDIYCLITDGEFFEGSVHESLNFIKENNLTNLKLYCNFNSYSAYSSVDVNFISEIVLKYCPWAKIYKRNDEIYKQFPFLDGLEGHYHIISDEEWSQINA
jgi:transketolase N-terminal domain/subunit